METIYGYETMPDIPDRISREVVMRARLSEVDQWYHDGLISEATAQAYCDLWNRGPCRFTYATVRDGRVRNTERND